MDSLAGLRTAAYARFSSDNQKDTSIDDQVRLCRDLLVRHNGSVSDEFVLSDYAISGVSKARAGFDQLLRLIESRAVDLVVTESADRLSRDLGDADRLWKLCEFHNVRLICASDGIDSARDGSRMQFQFKAVMSDQYLVNLGKQTLRGLRGAATRGTSTGGLPYGYKSEPIWNGGREPDGYKILIHEEQARIVVRIFEMYLDGKSLLTIAKALNDEAVPPPRAASKKRAPKFWRKVTVYHMLKNRAYVGDWTFGKKRWRKDPTTRKRRYTLRPESEVQRDSRPHLRIVADDLWSAVEARRKAVGENASGKGDGAPGKKVAHPFSGLLHCSACGHRMTDAGGTSARYYRCSGASSGGICSNWRPVREDVLVRAAIDELRRMLTETSLREKMMTKIAERLKSFKNESGEESRQIEQQVAKKQAEVERLVSFISSTDLAASPGAFETVRASLEKATGELRALEAKLGAIRVRERQVARVPTVEEIAGLVLDVETRIKEDPTSAREALRQSLDNGRLKMEPNPDGSYQANSVLFPLRLYWRMRMRKPRAGEPGGASEIVGTVSCAGLHRDFPDREEDDLPDCWAPFEGRITVGWE
jgi:site-specific DNA recombinase